MIKIATVANVPLGLTMPQPLFLALYTAYLRDDKGSEKTGVLVLPLPFTGRWPPHTAPNVCVTCLPQRIVSIEWDNVIQTSDGAALNKWRLLSHCLPPKILCSRAANLTVMEIETLAILFLVKPSFLLSSCLHPTLVSKSGSRHACPGSSPTTCYQMQLSFCGLPVAFAVCPIHWLSSHANPVAIYFLMSCFPTRR